MKKAALAALCALSLISCTLTLISCTPQNRLSRAKTEVRQVSNVPTRIASMAPASTSILLELGLAGALVATDDWSRKLEGVPDGLPSFDMMSPDVERLAALSPDLLLVSTITQAGMGKDPFAPLAAIGINVVYLPASVDIAGIASDVMKIAGLTGREKEGAEAVRRMNVAVDEIRKIAQTIPEEKKRTVVFELESAPYIYSFGDGVYLNEILETAGAINAFKKERGWISVSAESVIAANPDVILTNVASAGDPVAEIASRPGWGAIKAVKNDRIYKIDNMTSSQCAPTVVRALREIAEAVYPEYYR